MVGKFIGAAILLLVFGGLFTLTGFEQGFHEAARIWATALVLTCLIVVGIRLLVE